MYWIFLPFVVACISIILIPISMQMGKGSEKKSEKKVEITEIPKTSNPQENAIPEELLEIKKMELCKKHMLSLDIKTYGWERIIKQIDSEIDYVKYAYCKKIGEEKYNEIMK